MAWPSQLRLIAMILSIVLLITSVSFYIRLAKLSFSLTLIMKTCRLTYALLGW